MTQRPDLIEIASCPGVTIPVMLHQHPWPIVERFPSLLDIQGVEGVFQDSLSPQNRVPGSGC
jgi:hypothetical protein